MVYQFLKLRWLLVVCLILVLAACNSGGGGETATEPEAAQPAEQADGGETDSTDSGEAEDEADDTAEESTGDLPTADVVVADVQNAFDSLEYYQGSVDVSYTKPVEASASLDVFMKGSLSGIAIGDFPQIKGEVTSSTLSQVPEGSIAVFDSISYFYDPVKNQVIKADRDSEAGGNSQLFRIPMMFISIMTQSLDRLTSSDYTQEVVGEEQIGDFNTYKIECTSSEGDKDTVWVDQETSLPVQVDLPNDIGGLKATVTSMEVNTGFDDSEIAFESPEGAEEVELGEAAGVASLEEASSQAGFTAPQPGYLPEDLDPEPSKISVQETPAGNVIAQVYGTTPEEMTGDEAEDAMMPKQITIEVLKASEELPVGDMPANVGGGTDANQIEIHGETGTLMKVGEDDEGLIIISWVKDNTFYTVNGSGYSQEEVTKVAEGLAIE